MTDLLKMFLEASVMACAMTGVVLLVRAVLAKRMHPAVMLFLWSLVLVRLCLPFTIASPVNLITIPHQSISSVNTDNIPSNNTFMAASYPAYGAQTVSQNSALNTSNKTAITDTDAPPSDITSTPVFEAPISAWDISAYVWAAGAAATLLIFAVKAERFSRRVKQCAHVTDKRVLEIIAHHKEEAKIKKAITVLQCDFAHSPMVFGYFRPRVLIPSRFFDMNDESLKSILLHEVCHIRRRDILVNYVWLAAKALHWFNPLVWLAYEWYEDDMELCRDYNVARALKADGAFVYSMSLIEAARLSGQASPVPSQAAALFEKRCSLSARVLRLMKPAKKTRRSVVVSAILALVMLVACFTTACRPTPEKPPVINKNVDIVSQVVEANKEENKGEIEEYKQVVDEQIKALGSHLEMQMQPNKQVTINVDADIVSPGNVKIPVMRVQPKNFSIEQFNAFAQYVTNGQPLYYQTFNEQTGEMFSKEEMTAIMSRIKEFLKNKDLPDNMSGAWKPRIREMEKAYDSALSKADEKLFDGTLTVTQSAERNSDGTITYSKNGSFTDLKCYMGKDRAAYINLAQSANEARSQMYFDNGNYGFGYNTFEPYAGVDAERINITYEEAKAKAEEFVKAMDGEDTNMVMYNSSIGYDIGTISNLTKETSPQCYMFSFARSYNGLVLKRLGYLWGTLKDRDAYARQVQPETMSVTIDNDGICSACCQNQTEYIETVTEDTPLLDFNTVVDNFEQYCKEKFTWIPDDDTTPHGLSVSFNVKRVELNMMAIPEKDNIENLITVPVWDFIADWEFADKKAVDQEGNTLEGQKDISIVTINAINGTIINREQGY